MDDFDNITCEEYYANLEEVHALLDNTENDFLFDVDWVNDTTEDLPF